MGMRRVVATGMGMVSPLGDDPAAVQRALCEGRTGFRPVTRFDTDGLRVHHAAEVDFDPKAYLGGRNFRPVDRTGRLVIAAAGLALETAGLGAEQLEERLVGLVLGTMFGSVHTISAFDRRGLEAGPKYVKPLDFANSVINAAAGQTAIWHGLRGTNSTVAGGTTAGLQAVAQAFELIRRGRADTLLAGGGEELCFESFMGYHQAGLLSGSADGGSGGEDPVPRPFAPGRDGFLLGEGSALLVLDDAATALERGATVLGEVLGHGCFFDISRGRDARSAAAALERACRLALDDAGRTPADVAAVSAGASGLRDADRHEALGLAAVLGQRAADVPVTAVKSMLGESLGAAGAFQTSAALRALIDGELPGIPGLERPDPELPALGLCATTRPLDGAGERGCALVTAMGLDGNACALVLGTLDADTLAGELEGGG